MGWNPTKAKGEGGLGSFGWAFAHTDDVVELFESVGGLIVGCFNEVGDDEEDIAEVLDIERGGRTGGKAVDGGEERREDADVVGVAQGVSDGGVFDDFE